MSRQSPLILTSIALAASGMLACSAEHEVRPQPTPAPTSISDRGVQEHGKVWPRSIRSAYMGTWGDNRNSGSTLVTSFEERRLAGQSQYLSWTEPDSPPVSALLTNGSTEAPNGLIIAVSPRGGGTSTVVALDLRGKVVWRTQEWDSDDEDGDGRPDLAGVGNAVASSAGIQAPMVDDEGGVYVADNYGVWKLDQDTGERIWFSRFSDYSHNTLASNDLRLLNEGEDGLVGNVFASGWHIWLDRRDGSPVIVKEPDPFSAGNCPVRARMFLMISGGEFDKSGELDDLVCLGYDANNVTPQPNNLAVRPAIPGVSEHARYMFTYPGPPGKPDHARLIAYDFTYSKDEGWGIEKAWENLVFGLTAASPTITPDYRVVNASDAEGFVNFISVEDGQTVGNPDVHFNSFGSPGNTIDGLYCDLWSTKCVSPYDGRIVQADYSGLGELAADVLPELEGHGLPFLWGTTPDANLIGGAILDPSRWTFSATVGYPYFIGKILGSRIRMGHITPTAMIPVTFDGSTGEMMPGQTFGPELSRPGTSEANAMVTTSGRYVVQKAELSSLFFYYMLQGNYNFFNGNAAPYDDVDAQQLAAIEEWSSWVNPFGFFQPIGKEGVVPEAWKVPQPMSGLTIYEPVSMKTAAHNQAEMNQDLVAFALEHLCLAAGCQLEEAVARLGYASWNLEQAFVQQLAEATERGEVSEPARVTLGARAGDAAESCRAARELVLAGQPALPSEAQLGEARGHVEACAAKLSQIVAEL
ncbi:MAG: hypothetical protein GY910_12015 [bacterium]|nr:hypothetical protein [Deltaproteobacteria bacterium]MCP4905695.1 hypothetical protein [bacterium]